MAYSKRVSLILGLAAVVSAGSTLPAQADSLNGQSILSTESISLEKASSLVQAFEQNSVEADQATLAQAETDAEPAASEPSAEPFEAIVLDADVSTSADELMAPPSTDASATYDNSALEYALATGTVAADGELDQVVEIAQTTRPAYQGFPPAYVGVGGNLGIGDNESAISDFGFAVISKISLGPRFAFRPGVVIAEDQTSFLVPISYNFNVYEVEGFRFQPFAGVGADIATDGEVGLLVNTGVDVPISRDFTLNATGNFRLTDGFGFGLILGVGYNFPWIFE